MILACEHCLKPNNKIFFMPDSIKQWSVCQNECFNLNGIEDYSGYDNWFSLTVNIIYEY